MITSTLILTGAMIYFLVLFLIAIYTEKRKKSGHTLTSNPAKGHQARGTQQIRPHSVH